MTLEKLLGRPLLSMLIEVVSNDNSCLNHYGNKKVVWGEAGHCWIVQELPLSDGLQYDLHGLQAVAILLDEGLHFVKRLLRCDVTPSTYQVVNNGPQFGKLLLYSVC